MHFTLWFLYLIKCDVFHDLGIERCGVGAKTLLLLMYCGQTGMRNSRQIIKVRSNIHISFINLTLYFNRSIALYNHCQLRKTACHQFCKSTNSDHIHS